MNPLFTNFNNLLPINRKERYFTGTVLPQIICYENFEHINLFFDLIDNFPKDIVIEPNANANNNNIQFFTEYSLKESANFLGKKYQNLPKSKDTPDVVILITKPELYLIVIEAKMYTTPNISEFKKQIQAQQEVIRCIQENLNINPANIYHLGLVPQRYFSSNIATTCQMLHWENILGAYTEMLKGTYFYETLKYALSNFNTLVSGNNGAFGSFGKNSEDRLNGVEIITCHKAGKRFWVGRNRGLHGAELQKDKETGGWQTYEYEVNFTDKEAPNRNWFSSSDFVECMKDANLEEEIKPDTSILDPWHFSYLGKNYFENVSRVLGFGGDLNCPVKAVYTGIKGVKYENKLLGRNINPNWWVLMVDGKQLKYGASTTGNHLVQGNCSAAGYKRTSWKEIRDFNW